MDRKSIFANRLLQVVKHNKDQSQSYKKGLNQFSALTDEEFVSHFGLNVEQNCSATNRKSFGSQANSGLPASFDWRDKGVVSPVKNQGSCGSCWTFSTVGALESHFLLKYGQFRNLSEQQLVDCAGAYENNGCHGGLPSHAFEYLAADGGIVTEGTYPYKAVDQKCGIVQGTQNVGVVGGSVNISTSEDDLLSALYQHGPVSITFKVVDGFRDYRSGVYSKTACPNGPMDVNHAVLAVGYGTENGTPYWIVKNSWGAVWGDQGFFKIQRGVNMCGVAVCNSFPADVVDLAQHQFLQ